jgi:hypothetical protein
MLILSIRHASRRVTNIVNGDGLGRHSFMLRSVRFAVGGILSAGGWILGLCCVTLWDQPVLGIALMVGSGLAALVLVLLWSRDPELTGESVLSLLAEFLHKMS